MMIIIIISVLVLLGLVTLDLSVCNVKQAEKKAYYLGYDDAKAGKQRKYS